MTAHPVFVRTGIPGVGSIEVFAGGRIRIDGDIELNRRQWADLIHAVLAAGFAARDHDTKPIRRPAHVTDELDQLADHN